MYNAALRSALSELERVEHKFQYGTGEPCETALLDGAGNERGDRCRLDTVQEVSVGDTCTQRRRGQV